ncbi:NACHT, LRR and PYD domains-containing protein 3 isoform X24 [Danio rerio]|uniref:NACHT, LRR and PYD domains-containing protein 3 isoform X24 n=1 Tax=Danio rerio TaxID=7955 RepID=A0AC58J413_DANRE
MERKAKHPCEMSVFEEREREAFIQTVRAVSPLSSCVSMMCNHSIGLPPDRSDGAVSSDFVWERTRSPLSSCVSMKSNNSMGLPPDLSDGAVNSEFLKRKREESSLSSSMFIKSDHPFGLPLYLSDRAVNSDSVWERTRSPLSSCVSMKSNNSMGLPPDLSDGAVNSEFLWERTRSPLSSCVSMKSNNSMGLPPDLSDGAVNSEFLKRKREESSLSSSMFIKSDHPFGLPLYLSDRAVNSDSVWKRTRSPLSSCVSMKSNNSMGLPPDLSDGAVNSEFLKRKREESSLSSSMSMKSDHYIDLPPCKLINRKRESSPLSSCVSMKSNHSMSLPPYLSDGAVNSDSVSPYYQKHISHFKTEACLMIDSQQLVHDDLQRVKDQHRFIMKIKYESLFEGVKLQQNQTLLNSIYTQLYIIEGESEGVNEEHEVLQMEKRYKTLQDTPINCNDIFNPSAEAGDEEKSREEKEQIKTVLTKGIAGIGKTVSVQKFILDWAEGKANQDVDFIFVLPFRELNLIKDHQYSLHTLLLDFHPELQHLDSQIYEECKVVFIFDGLDESRITLMFSDCQKVSDVTEASSVSVLMSNLMKGDLLPSALIWITSRPAAANQIPSKHISLVTEIQGFNDPQKEEYFRKRIRDEDQASRIISHIRRARSLHIMCHIPVFCWISATVLQTILRQDLSAEIPQTLTEMYIHFLLIQTHMRKQKYEERDPEKLLRFNRDVIVKLAELAFNQLMKGNVMFYEEDLIESRIDVADASVYSGICTEIFREESVIYQRKVYSFVHLSFQECFAALYVFYCYLHNNTEVMKMFLTEIYRTQSKKVSLDVLLKGVMIEALKSKTGHLDLFLRFLHGVSLESNQRLLQDLLKHTENDPDSIKKIIKNLKRGQKNNVSPERWMNLSHCLMEMKDNSVVKEMQAFLKSKTQRKCLSLAQCSTLANMILMSEEVLDELDIKKYNIKSKEGRWRLIPAVRNCRKALLSECNLADQHCETVASALQSSNNLLREVNLSRNELQDSGVKLICAGLKSPNCQLNVLKLSGCNLTKQSCETVAVSLLSSNCRLRELDLSRNDLQDSGVKLICAGLKSANCQLNTLRFGIFLLPFF